MKKFARLAFFILAAFSIVIPKAAGDRSGLKISYHGFADSVELTGNRLNYSFAQQTAVPQAATRELSAEQIKLFAEWLDRCGVFSLTGPDVLVPEPNHPGAQEYFLLLVEDGDKKIELAWRGISRWNDPARKESLDKAIEELMKLASKLTR